MSIGFNTTLADYSMGELLSILDIKINKESEYQDVAKEIQTSIDSFVENFSRLNRPDIVSFFQQAKVALLGENDPKSTSQKNVINYASSYSSTVIPGQSNPTDMFNSNNGAGNPIHRKTVTKLLNIDSRFRDNYLITTPSNYTINLPYPVNNIIEMCLSDLELPSTYYPINTAYQTNYFWISTTDVSNTIMYYYIYIPDGNYSFMDFTKLLNDIFGKLYLNISIEFNLEYNNTAAVGTGTGLIFLGVYTTEDITKNESVGTKEIVSIKLNFYGSQIPSVTDSRSFNIKDITCPPEYVYYDTSSNISYEQRIGWMMGYREKKYESKEINGMNDLFFMSESVLDLSGPKYLFLVVEDFNNNMNVNFLSASSFGTLPDNIIARISLKCPAFSIQSQNDFSVYSEPRYYYGPINISRLLIQIIDEYGRILDFNHCDFSFSLKMTTVYSIT